MNNEERKPNTPKGDLSADYVRSLLDYDPETGLLKWRTNRGKARSGAKAGHPAKGGYLRAAINKKHYLVHRIAFLCVYGRWPNGHIDHRNGNKTDNRISNLREATNSINQQNTSVAAKHNKTTGLLGSSFNKQTGKFQAQISVNGKKYHLGEYPTPEEAHSIYINAKRRLHPGWDEQSSRRQ